MIFDKNVDLKKRPRMRDVELKDIALFYLDSVCQDDFIIEAEEQKWILSAGPENFCHLIGLHKLKLPRGFSIPIKGQRGIDAILNGDLTFKVLKSHDPGGVKVLIDRMLYFFFINQVMTEKSVYKFSPLKVYQCRIKGELMFADVGKYETPEDIFLHFVWGKECSLPCLIPLTFFVERRLSPYYQNHQPPLKITQLERVSRIPLSAEISTEVEQSEIE